MPRALILHTAERSGLLQKLLRSIVRYPHALAGFDVYVYAQGYPRTTAFWEDVQGDWGLQRLSDAYVTPRILPPYQAWLRALQRFGQAQDLLLLEDDMRACQYTRAAEALKEAKKPGIGLVSGAAASSVRGVVRGRRGMKDTRWRSTPIGTNEGGIFLSRNTAARIMETPVVEKKYLPIPYWSALLYVEHGLVNGVFYGSWLCHTHNRPGGKALHQRGVQHDPLPDIYFYERVPTETARLVHEQKRKILAQTLLQKRYTSE